MQDQLYLSPEMASRLAAIDIGSNSIRLVIAEPMRDGSYRILDEEKETTRLGAELNSTGKLSASAVAKSLEALQRMKQIAAGFQVRDLRVIATCAVREATDGRAFVRRAKKEIDLDIHVISSDQEARFAFCSVARNFDLQGKNVAVADIGGGSTEIVLASGPLIEAICPTPLGAVRMTEMFPCEDEEGFQKLAEGVQRLLRRHTKKPVLWPHMLIGSGGTFTTLADMVMAVKGQTGLPLRGYEVTHAELRHLLDNLRKIPPKARRNVPGLSPDRADIIVAGLAIVDAILHRFRLNRLQVHDRGVRDGLLLSMMEGAGGQPSENPHDQQRAVDRLAAACGVDLDHARHVARLAGLIFSQLVEEAELSPADQPLLEAAARLQDVGYLINYEQHHKHSYHLILNSRLAGFQPHELEFIANVARYHRGAEPKKKHENFARLSHKDQERVRKLASILRLAGGLDRSNTQQVKAVSLRLAPREVHMSLVSEEAPEVDLWGARRRSGPFEKAFARTLSVEWQTSGRADGGGRREGD